MRLTSQAESYQHPEMRKVRVMNSSVRLFAALAVLAIVTGVGGNAARQTTMAPAERFTADVLKGLTFRSIGPVIQTGRVQDIAIDPKNPNIWYVASALDRKSTRLNSSHLVISHADFCYKR